MSRANPIRIPVPSDPENLPQYEDSIPIQMPVIRYYGDSPRTALRQSIPCFMRMIPGEPYERSELIFNIAWSISRHAFQLSFRNEMFESDPMSATEILAKVQEILASSASPDFFPADDWVQIPMTALCLLLDDYGVESMAVDEKRK